jgi:hypothetical protein
MTDRYQVVGECAHVNVVGIGGVASVQLIYKGAFVPEGIDAARLKHLVDSGLVAKVEGEPIAPNAAIEQDPNTGAPLKATPAVGRPDSGGDGVHAELTDEQRQAQRKAAEDNDAVEQKRAAARAKLPADGSAPHHNAATEVWIEYAVKQGLDRAESEKASKEDLRRALQK